MQTTYGIGDYRTGEAAATAFSRSVVPATKRRPVFVIAGAGRTAVIDITGAVNPSVLAGLADQGYPVHCGDYCGHGSPSWSNGAFTWGNSESVNAITAAVSWMSTYSKSGKFFIFGGSMGAADALNFYKANPTLIAAMALTIPLLDLNDLAANDKGFIGPVAGTGLDASMNGLTLPQATINVNQTIATSNLAAAGLPGAGGAANTVNVKTSAGWQVVTFTGLANTGPGGHAQFTGCTGGTGTMSTGGGVSQGYGSSLAHAYGVTWPAVLSGAQIAASSPISWTEQAGGLTVPVRVWSSDNDFIASNTASCQAWAAAVGAAGGGNVTPTVVSMGNVGHNSSVLDAKQVAAFFNSVGGQT